MAERFLFLKGSAGFGNRIATLLSAIVYARLTDRTLVVDWSDTHYSPDGGDVFRRLFRCPVAHGLEELPMTSSVEPAQWHGRFRDNLHVLRKQYGLEQPGLSIDVRRLDYDAEVAVLLGFAFNHTDLFVHRARFPAAWKGLDSAALQRKLIADHLTVLPPVPELVERFATRYFTRRMIGVHVRQSDNMDSKHVGTKDVSVAALEAALATQANRDSVIFVATDNAEMLDRLRRRFPNVISRDKWYPKPGRAMHAARDCPDKLGMARDALVDMHLLARTDTFVYSSRSSFASTARLFARPGQRAIDIRNEKTEVAVRLFETLVDRARRLRDEVVRKLTRR